MQTILETLSRVVGNEFKECGYDFDAGNVSLSNRPELCEYQCNGALKLAKALKVSPIEIAKNVAEKLKEKKEIEKVEAAAPGFINITLSKSFVCDFLSKINDDKENGVPQFLSDKKILIDYASPNLAKPMHVGHLRSAIIGEAIKRLKKACGANVIGENYPGDWGLPMGLVIAGMKEKYPNLCCFKEGFTKKDEGKLREELKNITINDINKVYPLASQKSKVDKEFSKEAHEITRLLQEKQENYYCLWKWFVELSKEDINRLLSMLNVHIEEWRGESYSKDYEEELIKILEDKNLLVESEGAKVVVVEKEGDTAPMPPVIIKKSDGASIYATTDLAAVLRRKKEYGMNSLVYLSDFRQSLHFKQIFRCIRKAKLVDDSCDLEVIGFGTINGQDGKPYKTRSGEVVSLEDFLNETYEVALKKLEEKNFVSENEKKETAWNLAIASIKFGDLYNNRQKDYLYSAEKFLASEGKTGVYLLYSITRIKSILNKAKKEDAKKDLFIDSALLNDTEKKLLNAILNVPDVVCQAARESMPNYICEKAYEIASLFSAFYHDCPILSLDDEKLRQHRISICKIVKDSMLFLTDLLAIKTVDVM